MALYSTKELMDVFQDPKDKEMVKCVRGEDHRNHALKINAFASSLACLHKCVYMF